MRYFPGIALILGGVLFLLRNQGVIELPDVRWGQIIPVLIIAVGVAVVVFSDKVVLFWDRVTRRLAQAIYKIEQLYSLSDAARGNLTEIEHKELDTIVKLYSESPKLYQASKLWENLFRRHIQWIKESGLSNFKRSVNLGYFHWKIGLWDNQLLAALRGISPIDLVKNFLKIRISDALSDDVKNISQNKFIYRLVMAGLLEKTRQVDWKRLLDHIEEPETGNPWPVYYDDKLISQDICNSLIEYYSITDFANQPVKVVGEVGAGYGRLAYVFLLANPGIKYVIFDIPPAIYIAQWYLRRVFPDRKIFTVRQFHDFMEIQDDYEQSDIAFFLPEQLALFPEKHFDLFINISSFGEMRPDQIKNYFSQIERLCDGYFYTKQWITSINQDDNIVIRQDEYPVLPEWKEMYNRPTSVQPKFFEALYKIK